MRARWEVGGAREEEEEEEEDVSGSSIPMAEAMFGMSSE